MPDVATATASTTGSSLGKTLGGAAAAAGALSSLTSAITGISDAKKRREFEFQMSTLSFDEQRKVAEATLRGNNSTERLNILASAISQIKATKTAQEAKKSTNMAIIIIGGSVALLLTVFLIKKA